MSVFLALGIAGAVFLAVSLVLGDFFDAAFHFDALDSEFFSLSAIAAFVGALGFGGYAASAFSGAIWVTLPVGLVCGTLAAWGAISLTRGLKRMESGATVRNDALIGAEARVVTDIPGEGYGEVRILGFHDKRAATAPLPIPAGTPVWVSAIVSPTAVEVRPIAGELNAQ